MLHGPAEKLDSTLVSQVAIFVTSLAFVEALKVSNLPLADQCSVAAGLSLGEYTALVFAGSLSFENGLRLVKLRAEAMQAAVENSSGSMVSVLGCSDTQVEVLLNDVNQQNEGGGLSIANYLCPGNRVLSGDTQLCEQVEKIATQPPYSAKQTKRLAVAGAFHSKYMTSACEALKKALEDTEIVVPRIPIVCNLTGYYESVPQKLHDNLIGQLTNSVQWEQSIRRLIDDGYRKFYEVGPSTVLVGLMRHILKTYDTSISYECFCGKGI